MGKIFFWILGVPFAALVISFAASNRTDAVFNLWPLPFEIELPLSLAILAFAFLGFFLGAVAAWFGAGKWRRLARQKTRDAQELERRLETLRMQTDAKTIEHQRS